MIRLDSDKEYLRDTLLYNVFGRSLLFDNLETALDYRSYLVAMSIQPPLIFTLEGDRVSARAVLNPTPQGKCPADLEFLYGEQSNSEGLKSFNFAKKGKKSDFFFFFFNRFHFSSSLFIIELDMIIKRISLVERRESLSRQLGNYDGVEDKMREIRNQLEKL
jgi:hypothetical protein